MSDEAETSQQVSGHGLMYEGRPVHKLGGGTGGVGQAGCWCGARSEVLGSSTQRKRWHRQHKAAVLGLQRRPSALEPLHDLHRELEAVFRGAPVPNERLSDAFDAAGEVLGRGGADG